MIGTTIFLLVGPGFALAGPALILAFVISFFVTMLTAMAYAELSSAFPETGGGYLWVKTAFRDPIGFLGGWLGWFGHCIVCAFYVIAFPLYLVEFARPFTGTLLYEGWLVKGIALAVLAAFIYVNYRGTKTTGRSSGFVTVGLVILVSVYVVVGLAWIARNPDSLGNFDPFFPVGGNHPIVLLLMAMGFTFIVFEGYEIIAQTGEEVRQPERNIPRANWITLTVATTIFVLVGIVTIAAADPRDCGRTAYAVLCGAKQVFEPYPSLGLGLAVIGVSFGSLAALNSMVFSSSRVALAMGRDGAMPRIFGRLNEANRTPAVAIFASGLVIGFMTVSLDVIQIAASADLMFLLLFILVNAAAIRLRRTRPEVPRPYKIPLFPVVPLLGLGTMAMLAVGLVLVEPLAVAVGALWIVLGLAIHYLWARREAIVEVARAVEAALPLPEERYQILVPLEEFEDQELVRFASLVGRVESGTVNLMNVVEVPPILPLDAIDRNYLRSVRLGLFRAARVARDMGVDARSKVVVSRRVFEAILEAVKEGETNLLVLGWKGRRGVGRILGSNIDQVVQEAPCDVVVFKTAGLKEKVAKILVFNAPEWHVSYATGYAILLAKQHGASVEIYTAATTEAEIEKERAYSDRLAQMCRTHAVPYQEKFVLVQNIVDAVVEEAKAYDLLAVGASAEWIAREYAFGSVQDEIARRVACPVLMVRKVRKREGVTA
jgi:amino acid transporter/nucleotide-binding universal stress UspA family protein